MFETCKWSGCNEPQLVCDSEGYCFQHSTSLPTPAGWQPSEEQERAILMEVIRLNRALMDHDKDTMVPWSLCWCWSDILQRRLKSPITPKEN